MLHGEGQSRDGLHVLQNAGRKGGRKKEGEKNKKGIMAWFAPDSTHDCSGCGGKITVKQVGGGKGPTISEYTHTCTKCGDKSAYVCTDHKKA